MSFDAQGQEESAGVESAGVLVDIEEQGEEEERGGVSFWNTTGHGNTNVMDVEEGEDDDEFGDWEEEEEEEEEVEQIENEQQVAEPLACVDHVAADEVVSRAHVPTAINTTSGDVPCMDEATTRIIPPSDGNGNGKASLEQQQGASAYMDLVFHSKPVTSREYGDCVRRELGPWRNDGNEMVMGSPRRLRDLEDEFQGLLKKRDAPVLGGGNIA